MKKKSRAIPSARIDRLLRQKRGILLDISLGGTDDMGGATVIHVFGALYVQSSFPL